MCVLCQGSGAMTKAREPLEFPLNQTVKATLADVQDITYEASLGKMYDEGHKSGVREGERIGRDKERVASLKTAAKAHERGYEKGYAKGLSDGRKPVADEPFDCGDPYCEWCR